MSIVNRIADAWVSRRAVPDKAALAAVAGLAPATVVTGASRGIGLALARRFLAAGDNVVMVARDAGRLAAAAGELQSDGGGGAGTGSEAGMRGRVTRLALDITLPDAAATIDRQLAADGLYLDRLVNNAGLGLAGRFEVASIEELDALIALNVGALTRLMRAALPAMRARARGGILNVASLGGVVPGPHQAAYYASKAYVMSLTEAVAQEVRGEGVRVAVVAPGPVDTNFHAHMGAEGALYRAIVPALSPERVAAVAYRGFMAGRTVIVPGLGGGALAYLIRALPRPLTVPIVGRLLAVDRQATR